MYATENGFAPNGSDVVWTEENGGLARVPVYEVQQQVFNYKYASNDGMIYAGTHGRGIFRSDKFVGIRDLGRGNSSSNNVFESKIKLYPNPVVNNATIEFNLKSDENIQLSVYSITGRLIYSEDLGSLQKGERKVNVQINNLSGGTYIMTLQGSREIKSTKFIVAQ